MFSNQIKTILVVFVTVQTFGFNAVAKILTPEKDCTKINYASEMGAVRNQQDKGWCYANVSADLVSFYYRDELGETKVSSGLMAFIYNYFQDRQLYEESGVVATTLEQVLKPNTNVLGFSTFLPNNKEGNLIDRGFCPQSLETEALLSGEKESLSKKIKNLQKIKELAVDYSKSESGTKKDKKAKELWTYIRELQKSGSILKKFTDQQISEIVKASNSFTFGLHFADMLCRSSDGKNTSLRQYVKKSPHIVPIYFHEGTTSSEDLITQANDILSKRKNVLDIDYYSGFLQRHIGKSPQTYNEVKGQGEFHSSIIVGREWINGSCNYIVRNSWGETCRAKYRIKDSDVDANTYSPEVTKCEKGYIWVPEKIMLDNIRGITYIE